MRRISNSEAATWLTCKRKYYYEFDLALEPLRRGAALGRGILLHDILATYYMAIRDGAPHEQAVLVAEQKLGRYVAAEEYSLDTVMGVKSLLKGYWDYYQGDSDWEILAVEQGFDLPMTEDYEYSLRLDLYVRVRSTGKCVLVDHKTAYNFWTTDDLDLNPQFPKYIGAMRANGLVVDYALLNQIRTRKLKNPDYNDLFRRTPCYPSREKINIAVREQIVISDEITKHREKTLQARDVSTPRLLNKQNCSYCDVKPLCMSEYDGGEITHMIRNDFKARTYGYNVIESNEDM